MREIFFVVSLVIISLAIGALTDSLGWSLLCATVLWILWQAKEFNKLRRWSERPLQRPENGSESWFSIAYAPFRSLQRQRARTRQIAERLRQILGLAEFIPDGIIVLGAAGEIVGVNHAANKLLQLSDQDVGLGLATVVRQPDFVSFLRKGGEQEPLEFVSPVDINTTLEARLFAVSNETSIVLIRDITTQNRLLTMRQSFVANVSHELKTPLSVVKGYLETLSDPDEDPELKLEILPRLTAPVERLNALVSDLMLLTQLESTERMPVYEVVNLSSIVRYALAELGGVDSLSNPVTTNLAEDAFVEGVASELQSVCVNLISNALRYSPSEGSIDISTDVAHGQVSLTVADHGVGIAPEHINRLTERFYKVDLAAAGARGGTGLGLAIVKHVLRRHGSNLEITSELGKGSTFRCSFKETNNLKNQVSENPPEHENSNPTLNTTH